LDKRIYTMLVINPGSTSTKIALYKNENCIFEKSIFHDAPVLLSFPTVNAQLSFRKQVILDCMAEMGCSMADIDVYVARGGSCCSVPGGTYRVSELMVSDTRAMKSGMEHPSILGVQLAKEFADEYGGEIYTVDPPCLDELCDLARMTGIDGVYRRANLHALNQKGMAREKAKELGKKYEDCNFIVCHIDGGITVGAHDHGRIVDCNDGAGGDGPYTPTRIGSVSAADLIEYCRGKDLDEVKKLCTRSGGFVSHFGTSDKRAVYELYRQGDEKAVRVWDGMVYQICKYIGAMASVLCGRVDGILLGGGLVHFPELTEEIKRRCSYIAPITVYYEEFEHKALVEGTLRVLRGEEAALEYTGKPVWEGF